MTRRKKILLGGILALVAGLSVALVALGQTTGSQPAAKTRPDLWAKVAANLGISKDALVAALDKAEIELIDEALAAGTITAEQAAAMKARIEARKAMDAVLSQAVADGKITQEQLELLGVRGGPGPMMGRGFMGQGKGGGGPGPLGRCIGR
ncbi:MAG: hypothetical protein N2320_03275 [Candidatus Bipolaricaulota bacterium]|nr:hypothetical protein [Candidatus Bipolaricaulota bacterium]